MEEIMEDLEVATRKFMEEQGGGNTSEAEEAEPQEQEEQEPEEEPEEEVAPEEPKAYNAQQDFGYIVRQGSRFGYHFMLTLNNMADLQNTRLQVNLFRHKLAFQMSGEDSYELFGNKIASRLPEHICQYSNSLEQYSFRPYLHKGVNWDGWDVDENGNAVNGSMI